MFAFVFSLALLQMAHPSSPVPPQEMSWDEVMRLAGETPSVQATRKASEEKRELDHGIHGLGNPAIGISGGARMGENSNEGFDGEISVVQPFPLAAVGSMRRRAAEAESKLLEGQGLLLTLETRLAAADAFCLLHGAERILEEYEEQIHLAEESLAKMEKGRDAGAFTSKDVAVAKAFLAEAKLSRLEAEGEVFDRGIELARVLAWETGSPLRTQGPLPSLPLPPREDWMEALAQAERIPEVVVQRLGREAARARLQEKEKEGKAFWLGVGGTALQEGPRDYAVLGTVTLTLPLFERNLRERGALAAESRLLDGLHREAAVTARALGASLVHGLDHSEEVHRLLAEELVPTISESARLAGIAFSKGQSTLLAVLLSRQLLTEARAREHRADAMRVQARARLALTLEALGASLIPTSGR